jgi:excisionase family DNA binding protein
MKVLQNQVNDASVDESKVMTIRALTAYLNCHINTVYRLLKAGQLPAFRLSGSGGDWRFFRTQIDEWAVQHVRLQRPGKRGRKPRNSAARL